MKQSKLFHTLFPFVVLSIPWIYLALIWGDLPARIPTHFGINGEADKFGEKNSILLAPVVITIVGILMYFIMRNIHKIDPKRKYSATTGAVLSKIAVVTVLFLCGASLMIFYWTLKGRVEGLQMLFCAMGLFFAYIGNLLHSIKPNYFAGFRVPWALENEENWRRTHQLASKIWFVGGILLAILALLLTIKIMIFVFFGLVLIMTIIPVVYSYSIYRQSLKTTETNA